MIEKVQMTFPVEIWDQDADRPTTGVPGADVDAMLQRQSQLQRVSRMLRGLIDISSSLDHRRLDPVPEALIESIGLDHLVFGLASRGHAVSSHGEPCSCT